jgi:hypothetical protein
MAVYIEARPRTSGPSLLFEGKRLVYIAKNIALALVAFCFLAHLSISNAAGVISGGHVTRVRVDRDGHGYVTFDRALTETPASCISGYPSSLSFDTGTTAGRAVLSLMIAAKAMQSGIWGAGTGECSECGLIESWNYGYAE